MPWDESSNRDELLLMPRNVHTVYAYWQVSPSREAMAAQCFGREWDKLVQVLRLYRICGLAGAENGMPPDGTVLKPVRQLPLGVSKGYAFVPGLIPGMRYAADLGIATPEGRFVALLRSNRIELPFAAPGRPDCRPKPEASEETRSCCESAEKAEAQTAEEGAAPSWMERFTGYTLHFQANLGKGRE